MRLFPVFLLAALTILAPVAASAHHDHVEATQVWSRATPPTAKTGAVYMILSNDTGKTDKLVAVKSDVAEKVEIHTHLMEGGIMRMRRIEGVEVEPGTPVVFQPGGLHVMMIGLKKPLVAGTWIDLTLVYETAGEVKVSAEVLPIGATEPSGHGKAHTH
ncbi:MAG: copper chaperone PCu(A)C [Alphaproteobacteria bacterium]|nr:copper chaperone PCu(A)C [Alphaproteobacteria bacterium]MBU0797415.1 copper chaperone PCu(A)C [Alphaproteobacteria bacterium]MBU0888534.1 copper chaperone PCu(A)C [Alphaproteobacteria bacterium]MBU1813732.1 copper chaperone PCu(A)C [Alphaproteobacteria bacterium]MBU2091160.1 copper chaperone PCu(A)C [Alphaproteobacteria bacterium]